MLRNTRDARRRFASQCLFRAFKRTSSDYLAIRL